MSGSRPIVIVHMLSSVDGRLDVSRYSKPYNDVDNKNGSSYFTIAEEYHPDGILLGSNSFLESIPSPSFDHSKFSPPATFDDYVGKMESKHLTAIFDSKGRIEYQSNDAFGDNIIAVLGESVSSEYLSHLRAKGISYIFAGKDGRNYQLALEKLYSLFGMKKVLLEGGGVLNGAFLKQRMIDELSIIIASSIDGLSGISSIFEYKGEKGEKPSEGQFLELIETKVIPEEKSSVLLRYKVHKE
ncbi:putative 5-amino-6-(5-phosphoribosylamino)uracil reductase [Tritrichomonas foetus]|uniref:5-amino-6-(5-phosphoribosylamino)uracil reductase n=1 Tax=Tritrichomonas foetus TaxID=1144522 RepID=A0A1J4JLP4_9EUKA|nr:putative 5-amino-6-(5-phosphoribosylamino)uracil reductase [Tritrichomonas foetus]|eukprot:OHS99327.1 putative 5-amino-6-(5-phosphoribosylamino)uracil reductase [Tritrichomonas foetus]